MSFIKQNIIVLLAFALPILLILGIAASTYLPGVSLSTQYDFVYATCDNQNKPYPVEVECKKELETTRLFIHYSSTNENREVKLENIQNLEISPLLTSPDGVTLDWGYGNNDVEFFPFFGRSSQFSYYFIKGERRHEVNLVGINDYYSSNNFKFIGWIINKPYTK